MDVAELAAIAEQATSAPSIHNTQPWRLRVAPDRIEVWADRTRAVPVIDPTGRQLDVSCGAAIEYARLGIRASGHDCAVEVLPDAAEPDALAVLTVGGPRPATADDRALVAAMPKRHTFRDPFEPTPLPADLVEALRQEVTDIGGWLHVLHRTEDLVTTAVLLSRAEAAERADPGYLAELAQWVGADLPPGEGLPEQALARTPPAERASTLRLREFHPEDSPGSAAPSPGPAERPLIVILGTELDDRRAWLTAGRALARLLLRAAVDDVYASPLNQVLDQPALRERFARALGLLGYPQMMLRMGFAHPHATTERRSAVEVIDPSASS